MKMQKADYRDYSIRYAVVGSDGILLNTSDVRRVLGIGEHVTDGVFKDLCMSVAYAVGAALTGGRSELSFVDWLEKQFAEYDMQTPVHRRCAELWASD